MNSFFAQLADRATAPAAALLQPRRASRFESGALEPRGHEQPTESDARTPANSSPRERDRERPAPSPASAARSSAAAPLSTPEGRRGPEGSSAVTDPQSALREVHRIETTRIEQRVVVPDTRAVESPPNRDSRGAVTAAPTLAPRSDSAGELRPILDLTTTRETDLSSTPLDASAPPQVADDNSPAPATAPLLARPNRRDPAPAASSGPSPSARREPAETHAPVVRVSIGTVEVRMIAPPPGAGAAAQSRPAAPRRERPSLDSYLASRGKEHRA